MKKYAVLLMALAILLIAIPVFAHPTVTQTPRPTRVDLCDDSYKDNLEDGCITPTPSPTIVTPTATQPTATATDTPTNEPTITKTPVITDTPTVTVTATATITASPTPAPAQENWTSLCKWTDLGIQTGWWFTDNQGNQYGPRPYQTQSDVPWFGEFRSHVDGKLFVLHLADGRIFPFDFIAPGECNTPRPVALTSTPSPRTSNTAIVAHAATCQHDGVAVSQSQDQTALFLEACRDPWLVVWKNGLKIYENHYFIGNLMLRTAPGDNISIFVDGKAVPFN
jgi:hypothetical protein